ncbi:MAG TPA: MerR family transcriptional regulator [Kribbella sp.]|nr:MerR family transcriptional regulator [Kribbella sp.]
MAEETAGLSIGQVAERTGLSVHALRFYEREGILADPVRRESNGRRVYSEDDLEWLEMCVKFRSSGMPLDTIRQYTELVRQGPGNEEQRLALLRGHQERVTAQIHELNEFLKVISHKVEIYQDHLARGVADCLWTPPSTAAHGTAPELAAE